MRVGTWAARTGWRGQSGNKDSKVWRKILDLAWKVTAFCKLYAMGAIGVSSQEHSATRVDVGFTTVVEMLRLNWQTVGRGTVKDVNGKDCAY